MGRMEFRVERVKTVARRFRGQANYKESEAMEELRSKAMRVLRYNQAVKEITFEELFGQVTNGKDSVDKKAWLAFFKTADMEIKPIDKTPEKADEVEAEEPEKEGGEEKTEEEQAA